MVWQLARISSARGVLGKSRFLIIRRPQPDYGDGVDVRSQSLPLMKPNKIPLNRSYSDFYTCIYHDFELVRSGTAGAGGPCVLDVNSGLVMDSTGQKQDIYATREGEGGEPLATYTEEDSQ